MLRYEKDLVLKHPLELKLHRLVVIEKIRERICDNDKSVRETLYRLLENDIFPRIKEDATGPIISLLMVYVFNAMTHMAVDVRLMAFKFFNLIVQSFTSSFILYAEKVLDNYMDILRNNQIYLHERSNLKNVLDGLLRCMSSLANRRGANYQSDEPNILGKRYLHAYETVIHKDDTGIISVVKKLDDLVPILVNCFRESTSVIHATPAFDAESFDCMLKTIQCIDLAVKVFIKERYLPSPSSGFLPTSIFAGPNRRNTTITHLSRLLESFPIGKMPSSTEKVDERYFTLNAKIIEIVLHLTVWINDGSIPIEKFLEFIESSFESLLPGKVGSHLPSSKVLLEKHLAPTVVFIPRLVSQITGEWKTRLLEAFTGAFKHCKVDSKLWLAYLSAIEEMLLPVTSNNITSATPNESDMLGYHIAWIQHLPNILLNLGDKHPSVSKVVLKLILRIGQWSQQGSPIALEYDNLQLSLRGFYSGQGLMQHGSFMRLPRDCQELAVCSLYYMSSLSSVFLQTLVSCCLCEDMEPLMLLRVIEVLHSAYRAGHVHISGYIGFLVTLVAHKVFPDKFCITESYGKVSNRRTLKSLSGIVCSCLSQMGDSSLVLKLLCKNIFIEMSKKISVDNKYGLIRMIASLDTRPTRLSEENIGSLSNWLFIYLIEAASYMPTQIGMDFHSDEIHIFRHYVLPCIFLFNGSKRLLFHVLELFDSSILEDEFPGFGHKLKPFDRVVLICSILIFMHDDVRLHRSLSFCQEAIQSVLQKVLSLLESSTYALMLEEKHSIQTLFHQLKCKASKLQCSDASNLERV
ncbi:uncharacterized protein LOC109830320 isoform X2 [Asparagus officinalis]|uniref:uncharacterized protein LOC109830320 isoform X2 n=1 Tax=Asparagus officinalis TaxID=4686 RepID=UPI00098E47E5|nr:uncharacterized protein LOC109830320 isoform X2 [Asparagus officinalis]